MTAGWKSFPEVWAFDLNAHYNANSFHVERSGTNNHPSLTDGNKENVSENRNYLANAGEYFEKALEFLRVIPSSENEQAITYLNMADLAVIELGNEESESVVEDYIKNSYDLLEKSYNDGNQDFKMTAEKCIPVIRYYGYFVYDNTLQEHLSN